MKVFISDVDSPLGYVLSRLLSQTIVGSRREEEQPPEEDAPEEEPIKKIEEKQKTCYSIIGTLTEFKNVLPGDPEFSISIHHPSSPGNYFEPMDKKKSIARREAIQKFAIPKEKPRWVSEIINKSADDSLLKEALLSSDIIIYDLNSNIDECAWIVDFLGEAAETFEKPKTFVGISSLMTWAKTKLDVDDPEAFLAEDDYRRRKSHPNFKTHLAVEKNIIKVGKKSTFKTYVIAAGLLYHSGDCIFHQFLKSAWLNEPELTVYGDGAGILPTIHLEDLVSIVLEVVENTPEAKYLVAVDDGKSSYYDIVKAISDTLGNGKVSKLPTETIYLNPSLSQKEIDMLLLNLKIDPGHIKELNIEWKYETGLIESIQNVIQDYRDARGLSPLKVLVHGPPASGKSSIAKKISEYYKLHLIDPETVVQDAMKDMELKIEFHASMEDSEEEVEELKEQLAELKSLLTQNNGVFSDEKVLHFVKEKIKSMPCRNQGYVLDGYPLKTADAKDIFKSLNEDDSKDEKMATCDESIIPDNVISLEATDVFIKNRIMKLPDSVVAGTKNSEEALNRRLEEFRTENTDDNTMLNYFDELEIHPLVVSAEDQDMDRIFGVISKHIGKPHNYGLSPEQIAEKRQTEELLLEKEAELKLIEIEKKNKEEIDDSIKAEEEWKIRLAEVRKQEQDALEAQSLPLRNYLMKNVMPTVTAGLVEICKVRPEDPIDYLAEYLFKNNPDNS